MPPTMLFTKEFKEAIRAGKVSRTYRAWKRPQARTGGRYDLHPDGTIEVTGLKKIHLREVADAGARKAGFDTAADLTEFLKVAPDTLVHQVDFTYLGPGLAKKPTSQRLPEQQQDELLTQLRAMDRRAQRPWTRQLLELIRDHPEVRAADVAESTDWETARFKSQVRRLKALGLTISLETGYRLSDRGRQMLDQLARNP